MNNGGNGGPPLAGGEAEQVGTAGGAGEAGADVAPCENCGRPMVLKRGRFGPFLACSGYPECRTVRKLPRGGAAPGAPPQATGERCEKCGSAMVIKEGRFGRFIACSAYPKCRHIKSIPVGVNCPQCGQPLTERRTKRGRTFFGCSGYPQCAFALWDRPLPEACPRCGAPYLVEKRGRAGITIRCPANGCGYQRASAETASTPAEVAAPRA